MAVVNSELPDAKRAARVVNHATKKANGFACAKCGKKERILAVDVKAGGGLSTRCEDCLDLRSDVVRPFQWDEAERMRAAMR